MKEYDGICQQFIDHYQKSFQKLKFLKFQNYEEENQSQYKLLSLDFDLTDPTKYCFFINTSGKILSDFQEFTEEKLKQIKQTLQEKTDEAFNKNILSDKRFNYKVNEDEGDNKDEIHVDSSNLKKFIHIVKNFTCEGELVNKSNEQITIQIRKYFDINTEEPYKSERVDKITIISVLTKKYQKVCDILMDNLLSLKENSNIYSKIKFNQTLIDHRGKLMSTLKIIKDETRVLIDEEKNNSDNKITPLKVEDIELSYQINFENGNKKRKYNLNNKNKNEIFNSLAYLSKLSQLENEITKENKSPSYIFNDFNLIPRLSAGDEYVPLDRGFLSGLKEIKFGEYNDKVVVEESKFLILYFFAAWSAPSFSKLKELMSLAKGETKDKLRIVAVSIDTNFEELVEDLKYSYAEEYGQNLENLPIEIYYSDIRLTKEFSIFLKFYRAFQVKSSLAIVDDKGLIRLIDNGNVSSSNQSSKGVVETINSIINNKETVILDKTENKCAKNSHEIDTKGFMKDISNFYKQVLTNLNYSFDFSVNLQVQLQLDENFDIKGENVSKLEIKSMLRDEEDKKLQLFLESKLGESPSENSILLLNKEVIETVDLIQVNTQINNIKVTSRSPCCSVCNQKFVDKSFKAVYFCFECENLTCIECQPKHEHNLILIKVERQEKDFVFFNRIDKVRLGGNLAFYGTLKSRDHHAGCNKCETFINNKARFICLNCLPGKTPVKTGYYDYCEDCITKLINKWQLEDADKKEEIPEHKDIHDEDHHLYLRLDYAVSYFGY